MKENPGENVCITFRRVIMEKESSLKKRKPRSNNKPYLNNAGDRTEIAWLCYETMRIRVVDARNDILLRCVKVRIRCDDKADSFWIEN